MNRLSYRRGWGAVAWWSVLALGVLVDGDWPSDIVPAAGAIYLLAPGAYLLRRDDQLGAEHPS